MPDAVKISELPIRAAALPGDILPVVDADLTATQRVTAGQIAAIGGGPPGTGTVVESSLADRAVTARKTGFSAKYKMSASSTDSDPNDAGVYEGEEIDCTEYAQGLLAQPDGPSARAYIDALQSTDNPIFSGQVFAPSHNEDSNGVFQPASDAGEILPAYSFIGRGTTGLFSPFNNAIGFVTEGFRAWTIDGGGNQYSLVAGSNNYEMYPAFPCRAWATINAAAGGSMVINNPHDVGARMGIWPNSLWYEQNTINKVIAVESSQYGNNATGFGTVQRDGRSNYTTPFDNIHYAWDAVNQRWYTVPATGRNWIGAYSVSASDQQEFKGGGNVGSITSADGRNYIFKFAVPMPNANYCVVAQASGGSCHIPRTNRSTLEFTVSTDAVNTGSLDIAVFA